MIDSLYIGATGMHAQQANVDVISNNLANVNTSGFKRSRVTFEDLLYRDVTRAAGLDGAPDPANRTGSGVSVSGIGKIFLQGDLKKTDVPLDIAIQGEGLYEIILPDGSTAYSRDGHLQVNQDGYLSTADGHALKGNIQIPPDTQELIVQPDGTVLARVPGETNPVELGQIELTRFANPSALLAQGNNLYVAAPGAGEPLTAKPGEEGMGLLQQGSLESSNVKLIEEMISLIVAQRAYEVNSKVVQASDEMLGMSNNLRR
jgi:flagellar basal-body rod protein FlgG